MFCCHYYCCCYSNCMWLCSILWNVFDFDRKLRTETKKLFQLSRWNACDWLMICKTMSIFDACDNHIQSLFWWYHCCWFSLFPTILTEIVCSPLFLYIVLFVLLSRQSLFLIQMKVQYCKNIMQYCKWQYSRTFFSFSLSPVWVQSFLISVHGLLQYIDLL